MDYVAVSVGTTLAHRPQQLPLPGEAHVPQPGSSPWEAWIDGHREDHTGQWNVLREISTFGKFFRELLREISTFDKLWSRRSVSHLLFAYCGRASQSVHRCVKFYGDTMLSVLPGSLVIRTQTKTHSDSCLIHKARKYFVSLFFEIEIAISSFLKNHKSLSLTEPTSLTTDPHCPHFVVEISEPDLVTDGTGGIWDILKKKQSWLTLKPRRVQS